MVAEVSRLSEMLRVSGRVSPLRTTEHVCLISSVLLEKIAAVNQFDEREWSSFLLFSL